MRIIVHHSHCSHLGQPKELLSEFLTRIIDWPRVLNENNKRTKYIDINSARIADSRLRYTKRMIRMKLANNLLHRSRDFSFRFLFCLCILENRKRFANQFGKCLTRNLMNVIMKVDKANFDAHTHNASHHIIGWNNVNDQPINQIRKTSSCVWLCYKAQKFAYKIPKD